jgi:phytol kinase
MSAAGLGASFLFVFGVITGAMRLVQGGTLGSGAARKVIHIALSHWWLIAIAMFDDPWVASAGPALGLLGAFLAPLVPAEDGAPRARDRGAVCYSAALLILVNLSWRGLISPRSAAIGVFVMGWGDGLAGLVGARFGGRGIGIWGRRKTVPGTAAMFLASFLVTFFCIAGAGFPGLSAAALACVATAAMATVLELVTPLGIDNLVISLGTALFFAAAFR